MTHIYLITTDNIISGTFQAILEQSLFPFETIQQTSYKDCFKQIKKGSLVYIDIQNYPDNELQTLFQYLPRLRDYNYAIVDTKGKIKDPGSLFLNGASDYISKIALKQNLDIKRFSKATEFYPLEQEEDFSKIALSGTEWDTIKEEKEYTFCFFYIELVLKDGWRSKSGQDYKEQIKNAFYKHIETEVKKFNGKVWMRDNFKQIVLFPFDGQTCPAVLLPISLTLNKVIISSEEYDFDEIIDFSMAMHIGNTIYRPSGNTGEIISDDINYIHHVVSSYGEPGNFYITQNAASYIPDGLMPLFEEKKQYLHHQIFCMKKPVIY